MVTQRCVAAVPFLLFLLMPACGDSSTPNESGTGESVFFPTYPETGMTPAAIVEGSLKQIDGCLIISGQSLAADDLALWPDSYRFDSSQSAVVKSDGTVVAVAGEHVKLGGGEESTLEGAEAKIGKPIPKRCQVGNYWVVSPLPVPP
ncbi:MAG: hypothetical protein M3P43_13210 [Actinomycetota bacterium]|nr:hypothetical protein [Actinomycetota bacterium]